MSGDLAFVFPGQGTQRVGMGANACAVSPAAVAVFEQASDLAGRDMFELCVRSTEESLTDTENAQIAIYTTNAAVLALVEERIGRPDFVAGHSVGEWSAFHAAGVISFAVGFVAVLERARVMTESAGRGAMIAVVGLEVDHVEALCIAASSAGTVGLAVENAPGVVVCAGEHAAVEEVGRTAEADGAIRVAKVRTSHGFHSAMISPAVPRWRDYVAGLPFVDAQVPVAANLTGVLTTDRNDLRVAAVEQLDHRVRWRQCLDSLVAAGTTTFVEVGDSKTLTAFVRGTAPDATTIAMGAPNAIRRLRTRADGGRGNALRT